MFPGTHHRLTTAGCDPNIWIGHDIISNESDSECTGKAKDKDYRICTWIRQPDTVFEFLHIRGHTRVHVGTRFTCHGPKLGGGMHDILSGPAV